MTSPADRIHADVRRFNAAQLAKILARKDALEAEVAAARQRSWDATTTTLAVFWCAVGLAALVFAWVKVMS